MQKKIEITIGTVAVSVYFEDKEIDYADIDGVQLTTAEFLELVEALQEFLPKPAAIDTKPWPTNPGIIGPWQQPLVTYNCNNANPSIGDNLHTPRNKFGDVEAPWASVTTPEK